MFKLFLPIIFPSWRFFSSIGSSPRIHYAFLENAESEPREWIEFRVKPVKVPLKEGLRRLFHNPEWNETLYINTCAERLFEEYSEMREQEIMRRLLNAVAMGEIKPSLHTHFLTYKISAVMREGQTTTQMTTFIAKPQSISVLLVSESAT